MNLPARESSKTTDAALLTGDGRYGFAAQVEGNDLVVRGVRATWFGGAHDPFDNGQTASGFSTRRHPELAGCALPMSGHRLTQGSPLPNLPWMTTVVVVDCPATGRQVSVRLIDLGPSAPPHAHAAIDLTGAAFRALGGEETEGSLLVNFRIVNGALFLPPDVFVAARSASRAESSSPRVAMAPPTPGSVVSAAAPGHTPVAATLTTPGVGTQPSGGAAAGSVSRAVPPTRAGANQKRAV